MLELVTEYTVCSPCRGPHGPPRHDSREYRRAFFVSRKAARSADCSELISVVVRSPKAALAFSIPAGTTLVAQLIGPKAGRDQRWLTPPAAALRAVLCQLQLCLALAGPVVASEGARRDPTAARAGAGVGPCDITGKAGNPCVAAHSTTRALYAAYDGPLYRVASGKNCHPCVHKGRTCCGPGNSVH